MHKSGRKKPERFARLKYKAEELWSETSRSKRAGPSPRLIGPMNIRTGIKRCTAQRLPIDYIIFMKNWMCSFYAHIWKHSKYSTWYMVLTLWMIRSASMRAQFCVAVKWFLLATVTGLYCFVLLLGGIGCLAWCLHTWTHELQSLKYQEPLVTNS